MVLVVCPRPVVPVHSLKRLCRRNTGKYCILRLRIPKGHILDFLRRPLSRVGVPSRHPRFRFVQECNRCCELIPSLFILPGQLNIVTENDNGYSRSCRGNDVRNRLLPMENGSSSLNLHPAVMAVDIRTPLRSLNERNLLRSAYVRCNISTAGAPSGVEETNVIISTRNTNQNGI
jgi:hypothetical protein